MKKFFVLFLLIIVILAMSLYTMIPIKVDRVYSAGIFSGSTLIKEVPIHLSGKLYRGIFNLNQLEGTIELEGVKTQFATEIIGHIRAVPFIRLRLQYAQRRFPYDGIGTKTESNGNVIHTCYISFSKDWTEMFGYTDVMRKEYGPSAFFRAPKDLNASIGK